ncbi:hypothetical protein LFU01_15900 [Lysinibacillus fusiformis]|nr:hypothetical protein LFU01_15900 [Lysinibacillus fusiformis]
MKYSKCITHNIEIFRIRENFTIEKDKFFIFKNILKNGITPLFLL